MLFCLEILQIPKQFEYNFYISQSNLTDLFLNLHYSQSFEHNFYPIFIYDYMNKIKILKKLLQEHRFYYC